jgi:hypothetical protein
MLRRRTDRTSDAIEARPTETGILWPIVGCTSARKPRPMLRVQSLVCRRSNIRVFVYPIASLAPSASALPSFRFRPRDSAAGCSRSVSSGQLCACRNSISYNLTQNNKYQARSRGRIGQEKQPPSARRTSPMRNLRGTIRSSSSSFISSAKRTAAEPKSISWAITVPVRERSLDRC